ncbi:armadillo-like helical domain-containing protein 4 [Tachyglossus aculeatus]|uniref:armadillo-like helical domain-containing protein 4 n=1 Tax=Tachyglossus aculeatus TaxID=9261 RepID=UPI0018F63754|nr:armadillo-like helical domain-containing protein 4 [Tachyglossus aculeatus]
MVVKNILITTVLLKTVSPKNKGSSFEFLCLENCWRICGAEGGGRHGPPSSSSSSSSSSSRCLLLPFSRPSPERGRSVLQRAGPPRKARPAARFRLPQLLISNPSRFRSAMSRPSGPASWATLCVPVLLLLLSFSRCFAFPGTEGQEAAPFPEARAPEGEEDGPVSSAGRTASDLEPSEGPGWAVAPEDGELAEPPGTLSDVAFAHQGKPRPPGLSLSGPLQGPSPGGFSPTESADAEAESMSGPGGRRAGPPPSRPSELGLVPAVTPAPSLDLGLETGPLGGPGSELAGREPAEGGRSSPQNLGDRAPASEHGAADEEGWGRSASAPGGTGGRPTADPRRGSFAGAGGQSPTAEPGASESEGDLPSPWTPTGAPTPVPEDILVPHEGPPGMLSPQAGVAGDTEASASPIPATPSVPSDDWDDTKLGTVIHVAATRTQVPPRTTGGLPTAQATQGTLGDVQALANSAETPPGLTSPETGPGPAGQEEISTEQNPVPTAGPGDNPGPSTGFSSPGPVGPTAENRESDAVPSPGTMVPIVDSESDMELQGVISPAMATASREAEATLPSETTGLDSTLHTTGAPSEAEERREVSSPGSPGSPVVQPPGNIPNPSSTTIPPSSPAITPGSEVTQLTPFSSPSSGLPSEPVTVFGEEAITPVSDSSVTLPGLLEETARVSPAVPASVASSVRRTAVPSARRVDPAGSYGLDRLESEEGDEDEEEEEEEEEEDEDEEDKAADSLDDSMERDTEMPGFTFPGVTSLEPPVDRGQLGQLEGVSYQVPDAIEWEEQNQGLVRSWMEKLKDKAGYMSGMLVPVGVGIAGALFILGALYSIKIMNRRKRNGFKRHKRKQREFNSMQDRVMLLADSSEDEF